MKFISPKQRKRACVRFQNRMPGRLSFPGGGNAPEVEMENILTIYEKYALEDIDLAITLTARALNLPESTIRSALGI